MNKPLTLHRNLKLCTLFPKKNGQTGPAVIRYLCHILQSSTDLVVMSN